MTSGTIILHGFVPYLAQKKTARNNILPLFLISGMPEIFIKSSVPVFYSIK